MHSIKDINGEENKSYIIKNISKEGEIFIDKTASNNKRFSISKRNKVIFREINGLSCLNDGKPREITKIKPYSFYISDKLNYEDYISGGLCEEVKTNKIIEYLTIKERFYIPYVDNINKPKPLELSKIGRNELIHCGILAIHEFYEKHNNSLPELNDFKMSQEILEIAKKIYQKGKDEKLIWIDNIKWDDKIILNLAKLAKSEISPICSFLGGIAAQEIIKFTGKYTPINQWFWFEFSEILENLPENIDKSLKNSRYDDQIAIFGREMQNKIFDTNIFMVGAGALGCEFLKNFALMGFAINENKNVTVTDNDNIEISNLNRQFLFRKSDVGKSKSLCACREAKKINQNFNCLDRQSKIGPENENIFNEKFWTEQNYIINAVDNVEARRYIDKQSTFYEKCLIDSGTLGTIANMQTIVPHVTQCYNERKITDENPFNSIPMCTLHNFPSTIEHCIEWGRDLFNLYFNDNIIELKKYVENKEKFYEDLSNKDSITQLQRLTNIKKLALIVESNDFDKCIEFAVKEYNELFVNKINQLLKEFPEDYLNEDGSKFWGSSKRFPHTILYNPNCDLCLLFVKNFSIIFARALGISPIYDEEYIKTKSKNIELSIGQNKEYENNYDDINNIDNIDDLDKIEMMMENLLNKTDEKEIESIKNEINKIKLDFNKINPEKFEKDDDKNGHIDFIFACSNIRARNYNLQEMDKLKLKMIAGRITPALATTTAAITGIVCLQLYTLNLTNNINFLRNCFFNLAINGFIMTKPAKVTKHTNIEFDEDLGTPIKSIPLNWTEWDKIIIKGSQTPEELVDYINKKYNVKVLLIKTSNDITIFQSFLEDFNNNEKNILKIEDIYKNEAKKRNIQFNENFLALTINGESDGIPVAMPILKYIFN